MSELWPLDQLGPDLLEAAAIGADSHGGSLPGLLRALKSTWQADIDRADEAERIWFQEGYAQAEQKCEAGRMLLEKAEELLIRLRDLNAEMANQIETDGERLEELERVINGARRACAGALWLMGNDGDRSRLNSMGWLQPTLMLVHERLRNFSYADDAKLAFADHLPEHQPD